MLLPATKSLGVYIHIHVQINRETERSKRWTEEADELGNLRLNIQHGDEFPNLFQFWFIACLLCVSHN